jgi:hypothetical protein
VSENEKRKKRPYQPKKEIIKLGRETLFFNILKYMAYIWESFMYVNKNKLNIKATRFTSVSFLNIKENQL